MAKPRVIISTDIGGSDPDDMESMAHALLASDQWNLQGLISTPTAHGGRTGDIHKALDAYAKDYGNLKTWSSGYRSPEALKSMVHQGDIKVQPKAGHSESTPGSKAIVKAAHAAADAGEPLWVMTWGALTDVAQALHDDPSIRSDIRVLASNGWNWKQDPHAYKYVLDQAEKGLWMIDSNSQHRGIYINNKGVEDNPFDMSEVKGDGALGKYFFTSRPWGVKMGDSWSIAYLTDDAPNGKPGADSWGGSFVKNGTGPNYWTDDPADGVSIAGYDGARHVRKHQKDIYEDMYRLFDRADGPNPKAKNDGDGGQKAPPSSSKNAPVHAADDAFQLDAGEKLWTNSRYFTWNDKGKDGGLKVTAVDKKSAEGVKVNWKDDGTLVYKAPKDFDGVDTVSYTVVDKNGSTDRGQLVITVDGPRAAKPAPKPDPAPRADDGDPVKAVKDWYTAKAGDKLWVNARFFANNDKGDGKLEVVGVDRKSDHGGRITFNEDNGTVTYKAAKGFGGRDRFDYTVADADGDTDVGTIIVQVTDVMG